MTPWVLSQCAAPAPDQMPAEVVSVAGALTATSARLAQFLGHAITRWDPGQRELLDARSDALIAKAYGLTLAEYEVVLGHFRLLEKIETRELGEYRSRRLRMEAFEQIGGGR